MRRLWCPFLTFGPFAYSRSRRRDAFWICDWDNQNWKKAHIIKLFLWLERAIQLKTLPAIPLHNSGNLRDVQIKLIQTQMFYLLYIATGKVFTINGVLLAGRDTSDLLPTPIKNEPWLWTEWCPSRTRKRSQMFWANAYMRVGRKSDNRSNRNLPHDSSGRQIVKTAHEFLFLKWL